jgi:hypothetical protein
MEHKNNDFIILLSAMVLVLGGALMKKNMSPRTPVTPLPSPSQNTQNNTPQGTLTDEVKNKILNPPAKDAPKEAHQAYIAFVSGYAKTSNTIDITDCSAIDPLVLQARENAALTLVNRDTKNAHGIGFDAQHIYNVPAGKTLPINLSLNRGPGLYGYGCDRGQKAAGFLWVTP